MKALYIERINWLLTDPKDIKSDGSLNFLWIMKTNIVEIIQTRLDSMGTSQAQFAKCISATPSQMCIFLKGKGSLSTESLNKSLEFVGVNLSLYSQRTTWAREIAE